MRAEERAQERIRVERKKKSKGGEGKETGGRKRKSHGAAVREGAGRRALFRNL